MYSFGESDSNCNAKIVWKFTIFDLQFRQKIEDFGFFRYGHAHGRATGGGNATCEERRALARRGSGAKGRQT